MAKDFDNNADHERYFRKNQALSRAYDIERKDKIRQKQARGEIKPIVQKCQRCNIEKPCLPYYTVETGYYDGVASVAKEQNFLCEECAPGKKKHPSEMSKKQIKSLLRGAKHGRI